MDLFIKLNAEKDEDLQALKSLTEKLTGASISITEAPWPELPAKEEKEPEPYPESEKEEEVQPESGENISIEDVRGALIKVKDKLGPKKAKALLTEFGVSKATDLPEESFKAVLEKAERELKNA